MALTAAEKQKAYRARKKSVSVTGAIIEQVGQERFCEGMDAFMVGLLDLIDDLYGRRASNTTWRQELRRVLLADRA